MDETIRVSTDSTFSDGTCISGGFRSSSEQHANNNNNNNEELHDSAREENDSDKEVDEKEDEESRERRMRRMVSNRESARRSRSRKHSELVELETQVAHLRLEHVALMQKLTEAGEQYSLAASQNSSLKSRLYSMRHQSQQGRVSGEGQGSDSPNGQQSVGGHIGGGGGGFPSWAVNGALDTSNSSNVGMPMPGSHLQMYNPESGNEGVRRHAIPEGMPSSAPFNPYAMGVQQQQQQQQPSLYSTGNPSHPAAANFNLSSMGGYDGAAGMMQSMFSPNPGSTQSMGLGPAGNGMDPYSDLQGHHLMGMAPGMGGMGLGGEEETGSGPRGDKIPRTPSMQRVASLEHLHKRNRAVGNMPATSHPMAGNMYSAF